MRFQSGIEELPEGSAKRSSLTRRPAALIAAIRRSLLFPIVHSLPDPISGTLQLRSSVRSAGTENLKSSCRVFFFRKSFVREEEEGKAAHLSRYQGALAGFDSVRFLTRLYNKSPSYSLPRGKPKLDNLGLKLDLKGP